MSAAEAMQLPLHATAGDTWTACASLSVGLYSGLTVPGRGRPSNQQSAGRTRWAFCCSPKPSWRESGGWIRRSSDLHQTAVYQACIHPNKIVRQKTNTLIIITWTYCRCTYKINTTEFKIMTFTTVIYTGQFLYNTLKNINIKTQSWLNDRGPRFGFIFAI